jgi:hypothetical protein
MQRVRLSAYYNVRGIRRNIMGVSEVGQLISTYGFPVVACCAMAWYVKYITDSNNKRMDSLNEQHANEMKDVTTAINNNTIALTKIASKIGGDDVDENK